MKYEGVADFVLHYKIVSQAFYLLMPGIVGVREVTCRHLLTTNAFMPHLHDLIVARCTTAQAGTVTLRVILSGQCWAVYVYDKVLVTGFVLVESLVTQSTHHRFGWSHFYANSNTKNIFTRYLVFVFSLPKSKVVFISKSLLTVLCLVMSFLTEQKCLTYNTLDV